MNIDIKICICLWNMIDVEKMFSNIIIRHNNFGYLLKRMQHVCLLSLNIMSTCLVGMHAHVKLGLLFRFSWFLAIFRLHGIWFYALISTESSICAQCSVSNENKYWWKTLMHISACVCKVCIFFSVTANNGWWCYVIHFIRVFLSRHDLEPQAF